MFNKNNYSRKHSAMSLNRKCSSYIQPYFRNNLLKKTISLIIIFLLFLICLLYFNKKGPLCNPEEHLWWFCPWPDPKTTVCAWDEHFPIKHEQIRSPESYEKLLSTLPKVRSSFEFNNLTLNNCKEESIDLLIFIISKCSHLSIRQSIRRTWGNIKLLEKFFPKLKLKLLFLLDFDEKTSRKIELEYLYHNDIVQIINLPEQYQYVTEREAGLYEFINKKCKQTKFIFKTDDDIFLNTFLLLLFVKNQLNQLNSLNKYLLFGFPIEYGLVVRYSNNYVGQRYIITKDEYLCSRYPIFLSGFGYFMSFETSSLFYNAYLTDIKPFPLSDVYFTGLLSQMFNIQRKTIFQNVEYRYDVKCTERFFTSENIPFACAASDDHFNEKESGGDKNLMNDYNLYWMKLIEKYDSSIINGSK